jgi:hypothetical protein
MSGFKIVSGIEDSRSRPNSINYTYDFAYIPLKRAEPVVEAGVQDVSDTQRDEDAVEGAEASD